MRILGVTNLYPNPFQPNRATFNRQRFAVLGRNHDVRIIAPISWIDEWKARRRGATPLPSDRKTTLDGLSVAHPKYWYVPKIGRRLYGWFFLASIRSSFDQAVHEFRPDVILACWAYPDGWAAVRLARRYRLPAVVLVHGSDVRLCGDMPGRRAGTAWALRNAAGVVTMSKDLERLAIKLGASPDRVQTVYSGVHLNTFSPGSRASARSIVAFAEGKVHLLFVGNLVHVKGIDVLLNACALFGADMPAWELHLVGEGSARAELVRRAHTLGLGGRVHFHGSKPHGELPNWFRAADLFILASRSEGFPTVLLEAAACGLPFVATNVGGIPEILGAVNGLVPPDQPEALAAVIASKFVPGTTLQPPPPPRDILSSVHELGSFLHHTLKVSRIAEKSFQRAAW